MAEVLPTPRIIERCEGKTGHFYANWGCPLRNRRDVSDAKVSVACFILRLCVKVVNLNITIFVIFVRSLVLHAIGSYDGDSWRTSHCGYSAFCGSGISENHYVCMLKGSDTALGLFDVIE